MRSFVGKKHTGKAWFQEDQKYFSFFVGGKREEDLAKGGRKGYCRAEHVQFRDYRSG